MSSTGEWDRGSQPPPPGPQGADPFVPPSNPAFGAPRPPQQGGSPYGASQPPWPSAGSVAFTPSTGAPTGAAVTALVLAILGALVGLAIGWGFPLSVVALVLALRARATSGSSRTLSTWSIVLVVVSALASIAWLVYSAVYILG